jgi:hypothetical protein
VQTRNNFADKKEKKKFSNQIGPKIALLKKNLKGKITRAGFGWVNYLI